MSLLDAQIHRAWLLLQDGRTEESQEVARAVYDLAVSHHDQAAPVVRDATSILAATHIVAEDIAAARKLYGDRRVPETFGIEHTFQGKFDMADNDFKVLVFFETWCPFSRLAMGDLATLYRQYNQFGLDVIGMTRVSRNAEDKDVDRYISDMGIDFTVVKENGRSWNFFECKGTPSVRLVSNGYLIWEKGGYTSNAIAIPMLESMVSAAQSRKSGTDRSSG